MKSPGHSARRRAPAPKAAQQRPPAKQTNGYPPVHFKNALLAAGVVAIAAAAIFGAAINCKGTCFDDYQYVGDNALVKSPSLASAQVFLTEVIRPSTVHGYYQPLAMISLMLDCGMGARLNNPWIFHATSIALHAASSALVAILLYLLLGNAPVAALAGLLFAAHPMSVDVVAWVAERKTGLATFFALLSLIFYALYARRQPVSSQSRPAGGPTSSARRWTNLPWMSLVFFMLAVMSKPTTVMLPLAFLLVDYWPLRRVQKMAFLEKIPMLAVMLASGIITLVSQKLSSNILAPQADWGHRLLVMPYDLVFYPIKMAWPAGLTPHYIFPDPMALSNPVVLASLLGSIGLLALLAYSLKWTRVAAVGGAVFIVLIFPALGIVGFNDTPASNKFIYLPVIGLLAPLAALGNQLWQRRCFQPQSSHKAGRYSRCSGPGNRGGPRHQQLSGQVERYAHALSIHAGPGAGFSAEHARARGAGQRTVATRPMG